MRNLRSDNQSTTSVAGEHGVNSEVSKSVRIIKVINQHLAEEPDCKCSIRDIMKEAIQE